MYYRLLSCLLLSAAPALAIPPPDFGFPEAPNHTELSITYQDGGKSVVVTEAELFGVGSKCAIGCYRELLTHR